jgi:hypothetical protein
MTFKIPDASQLFAGRRRFLAATGLAGIAGLAGFARPLRADDELPDDRDDREVGVRRRRSSRRDIDILNFALNLEYLEAEFYLRAAFGRGLADADTAGVGELGGVVGGQQVNFTNRALLDYATEIAIDEENHVKFLRAALGERAAARPAIDLASSFSAAAAAAGLIAAGETFDPFANELNFLLGAYIFEDVGVTAYAGAAPLLANPDFIGAAAQILAVEAYHAANVRTTLFALSREAGNESLAVAANAISDARDSLDGEDDRDQGIVIPGADPANPTVGEIANIVPTDANGLAFTRSPSEVLGIVYLNPLAAPGGFFPNGTNGQIR